VPTDEEARLIDRRGQMGVGEIVSTALGLYRAEAVALWKIALVIVVPIAIIDELIFGLSLPSDAYVYHGTIYVSSSASYNPGALAIVIPLVLDVIGPALAIGALSKLLLDVCTRRSTGWRHSLDFAVERLGPLIWLSLIVGVLFVVGLILLVIPGIWVLVICSVAIPVLMFEGAGNFGAIRRSHELVRGRWWATFGALLVGIVLLIIAQLIVGAVIGAITTGVKLNSLGVLLVLAGIGRVISLLISLPFYAALTTVIYLDLRARHGGPDLEVLSGGFLPGDGLTPPPSAPPLPKWPP
jgi:hypothetical protein